MVFMPATPVSGPTGSKTTTPKDPFVYKANLDSAGNDLYGRKMTLAEAKAHTLATPGIAGFVMINDGTALFKSSINANTNACWDNICSNIGSGLYIKV